MEQQELIRQWLEEEKTAHIKGWDFSHIADRYGEDQDLPWNYRETVCKYLTPDAMLLDMDTGGGEFLLSLHHPWKNTCATEGFPPNVRLCRETLLPLGIDFREADCGKALPYGDNCFDVVINRHGSFQAEEIFRVLKPGGVFITEQVGAENDRDLVQMLLPDPTAPPFPEQYLNTASEKFRKAGFSLLEADEAFRPIRFWDVGALVWFAHILEWEFPGFSVMNSLDQLLHLQAVLEKEGVIEGRIHRFLLVARKI